MFRTSSSLAATLKSRFTSGVSLGKLQALEFHVLGTQVNFRCLWFRSLTPNFMSTIKIGTLPYSIVTVIILEIVVVVFLILAPQLGILFLFLINEVDSSKCTVRYSFLHVFICVTSIWVSYVPGVLWGG